jgi:DNA-binding transcriptional LysR family regulator
MELRELRAFVAAGQELHFARAAAKLYMSPSTMSELIRKLELELGTALFTRTTRRITLTEAGVELLGRAETILDLTAQAAQAVAAIGRERVGAVRLGITPPAGPAIAPHLAREFRASRPELSVEIERMWLPALRSALQAGTIDAALTCGDLGAEGPDITTAEIGSEQLLVGLRPAHPLSSKPSIELHQLADRTLGIHPAHLFPAWHAVQRQVLADAGLTPPITELEDPDLSARLWTQQPEVEWIMLISSLFVGHAETIAIPSGATTIPFTLSWTSRSLERPIVRRFVDFSLHAALPNGWLPPRL